MSYWINIKVENSIVSMLASSWLICYWLLDVCGTKCSSFLHFRISLPIFSSLKLSRKFRISVWNLIFDEHGMDSIRLSRLIMYRRSCVHELNEMNWIRTIGETVNIKKNNSCIKIDGDKSIGFSNVPWISKTREKDCSAWENYVHGNKYGLFILCKLQARNWLHFLQPPYKRASDACY